MKKIRYIFIGYVVAAVVFAIAKVAFAGLLFPLALIFPNSPDVLEISASAMPVLALIFGVLVGIRTYRYLMKQKVEDRPIPS